MKKIIFIFAVLFFLINADSFTLKGKVLDKTLIPISDANVKLNEQFDYYTDSDGNFIIDNVEGYIRINISKDGYKTYNASFFINKDSFFSAMLEEQENIENDKIEFMKYPSLYGISGGIDVLNSQTLNPDKYNAGFDIFRIMFKVSGNSTYRTTSNLRFSYGIGDNTEAGVSFFITEDNNFNVVNEDNVFSLKKSFEIYEKDMAIAFSTREGSDVIYLVYEDKIEKDLKFIANINYNLTLSKEKFDTSLVWAGTDSLEVCAENVQDYVNNSSQRSLLLRYKMQDYITELYYIDNSKNNYEIIGAGFSLNF